MEKFKKIVITLLGNHEYSKGNLIVDYSSRFLMPINSFEKNEVHYSFNYGPIHFISVNTEVYYHRKVSIEKVASMYFWLRRDLELMDRKLTPWVVLFGHRYVEKVHLKNHDLFDSS